MDNSNKLILELGKNMAKLLTINELSKRAQVPYATAYRKIKSFSDLKPEIKRIINLTKVGSSELVSLSNSSDTILRLANASNEELISFCEGKFEFNKLLSELFYNYHGIVILFGSYAKGSESKESDIDLLIINSNGSKDLDFSKYETLFAKEINPLFFSYDEFKLMLNQKDETVAKQALQNHILFNNHYKFWSLVLDGI